MTHFAKNENIRATTETFLLFLKKREKKNPSNKNFSVSKKPLIFHF